jgi:hypothetical protein
VNIVDIARHLIRLSITRLTAEGKHAMVNPNEDTEL